MKMMTRAALLAAACTFTGAAGAQTQPPTSAPPAAGAAPQGHVEAQANYGLLLFQNGRRREAMPWIEQAANRGDPRAQYVFGTALYNGDLVAVDLPRAYAMMTRAAAAGLPPAVSQLAA